MMLSTSFLPWCLLHGLLTTWGFCVLSSGAEKTDWMTASREPLKTLDAATLTQDAPILKNGKDGNDCQFLKWKGNPEEIATHLTVIYNDTFRLKCPAEGKPKLTIRWLKNGKEFTRRWKGNITTRGNTLEVKEAQTPFDEGNYTCIINNSCGSIQQDFSVRVIVRYFGKPVFDGPLENQTATVGSNVTLVCRALSDAAHAIFWLKIFKNNTHQSFDQLKTDERQFLNGTHLIIYSVQPDDSGQYACVAVNEFGSNNRSAWIFVYDPESIFEKSVLESVSDEPLENQTVSVGNNVTLVCQALNGASRVVHWLKLVRNNTHQFDVLKTDERQFLNGTHLIIYSVQPDDSGQYACVAVNEFGSNNRSAWIFVYDPDGRTESPAIFYYSMVVLLGVVMFLVLPLIVLLLKSRRMEPIPRFPLQSMVKQWEISKQNLKLFEAVGEGEFGIVYRGQITGTPDICGYLNQTVVAVKMLKGSATDKEMNDIFTEMETMKNLGHHPNVIQFIGCCSVDGPLAVVMEYAAYGSLKNVLRMCKSYMANEAVICEKEADFLLSGIALDSCFPLTSAQLRRFSLQVAKGMEYLAKRKIVHRDVAARNVLVAENFVAKIADFGLTRDVTSSTSEQYIPGKHRCLPLKWMSPESLVEKVFTTKSDVWSFGVLLWEIFTYGSNPYPTVPIQNLFSLLKAGYRMGKPSEASDEMYLIMQSCWHFDAKDRPCFSMLLRQLESSAMTTKDWKIVDKNSEEMWKSEFIHQCE